MRAGVRGKGSDEEEGPVPEEGLLVDEDEVELEACAVGLIDILALLLGWLRLGAGRREGARGRVDEDALIEALAACRSASFSTSRDGPGACSVFVDLLPSGLREGDPVVAIFCYRDWIEDVMMWKGRQVLVGSAISSSGPNIA